MYLPRSGKPNLSDLLAERVDLRDTINSKVKTVYHGRLFAKDKRERRLEDQRKVLDPFFNKYDYRGKPVLDDDGNPVSRLDSLKTAIEEFRDDLIFTDPLSKERVGIANQLAFIYKSINEQAGERGTREALPPGSIPLGLKDAPDKPESSEGKVARSTPGYSALQAEQELLASFIEDGSLKPGKYDLGTNKSSPALHSMSIFDDKFMWVTNNDKKLVGKDDGKDKPYKYIADPESIAKGTLYVFDDKGKRAFEKPYRLTPGLFYLLRSHKPDKEWYTEQDLKTYAEIISQMPGIKSRGGNKHKDLFGPTRWPSGLEAEEVVDPKEKGKEKGRDKTPPRVPKPNKPGSSKPKPYIPGSSKPKPAPPASAPPRKTRVPKPAPPASTPEPGPQDPGEFDPLEETSKLREQGASGMKKEPTTKIRRNPIVKITRKAVDDRIKLLEGTIRAGNTSKIVRNELSDLLDYQLASGMIGPRVHKQKIQTIFGPL